MTPEQLNALKQAYAGMQSYNPGDALSFDVGVNNPFPIMGSYQSPINQNWDSWLKGAEQTGYTYNPATNAWEMQGLNSAREQSAYSIPVGYNYTEGNELPYVIGADGELKMANTDFSSPDQFAQSFNQSRSISPLDYNQFRQVSDFVSNSAGNDFIDVMGRVISPGTSISVKDASGNVAGKYIFTPPQQVDQNGVPYLNTDPEHTNANWMTDPKSWQWQPVNGGTAPIPIFNALRNAGIAPKSAYGDFLDQGVMNAIAGTMPAVSGAFGAVMSGVGGGLSGGTGAAAGTVGTLGGESISIAEALENFATYADLVEMGFDKATIAMNASQVAANELSSMGLNQGVSNALVKSGTGAALNYAKSGGDPMAALKGAASPAIGGLVNYGAGAIGDLFSGGNDMGIFDLSGDDMDMSGMTRYDGGSYPSYDSTGYLGNVTGSAGGGNWYDSIDWGKLAVSAIPAASGIIGGLLANNAQGNATDAAAKQYNNGLNQQWLMYQQQRADFAPYAQMGTQGVANYNKFVADPNAYMQSPAYMWQKDQIDKNMNRQLSARGRSNSTYGMQALGNAYGNLASTEYDKAYNRMLDPIKVGQGAAVATGNAAQNMGGAYQTAASQLAGNATQAGANNASLYSGLGAMPQNLLNTYNTQQQNQSFLDLLNRGQ